MLIEYLPFKVNSPALLEAMNTSKDGRLIVEGTIQRADAKNQNGRVYPKPILERELKKYIDGPIRENRACGELDHPDSSIINLKNVSHNILKLWWDNDDVKARIEILCDRPGVNGTPSGNILASLIKNNITVGISSRGMGSVQSLGEGTLEVQDDFDLLCWDFVSTPSTQGAFMAPINEGFSNLSDKYTLINELITDIICTNGGYCSL